jgi:hypothetical protein
MSPLALALAALIGVSLGLLGGGGSILTVPVLVYVLGYGAKPAIAMSLPIVGVTALAGALLHWRRGNVRPATAVVFGALAMLGAFGGARLARFVPGAVQLVLLALLMLAAAGAMFRGSGPSRASDGPERSPHPEAPRRALVAGVAIGVGMLTGLVGIGGGFLIVPALVLLLGVPMRSAVGTSLLVIAMNSAAGLVGYLGTVTLDWPFLARFTGVAIVGTLAGAAATGIVPQGALRRGFAVLLLAVGAFVLYGNRTAFTSTATSRATGSTVVATPTR